MLSPGTRQDLLVDSLLAPSKFKDRGSLWARPIFPPLKLLGRSVCLKRAADIPEPGYRVQLFEETRQRRILIEIVIHV
jgi:hypothetical protein